MGMRFFWPAMAVIFLGGLFQSGRAFPPPSDWWVTVRRLNAALARYWYENGFKPAPLSSDSEFLRRVTLDLIGNIPTVEEARRFLTDRSPDKRQKLLERLLNSPEYARWWASVWRIWLIGRDSRLVNKGALEAWLEKKLAANDPYNEWVYALLTATGENDTNGAVNFFLKYRRPSPLAGAVTRLFLGIQIQCAQCHDSPLDRWKQDDFWGIAAYFARVRIRVIQRGGGRRVLRVWDAPRGEVMMERGGQRVIVRPKFLFANLSLPTPISHRRAVLAYLITHPENRQFAKALVNRYWAYFFGHGLVHPIDGFGENNRPYCPEALEVLTDDFIRNGYDLKRLIRIIVNTRAYQLSCRAPSRRANPPYSFAQAQLRPLMPEQLFNALLRATGSEDLLKERFPNHYKQLRRFLLRRFVFVFKTDAEPDITAFEQTIQQALLLMNNEQVQRAVRLASGLPVFRRFSGEVKDEALLDELFLRFYARYPTPQEKRFLLDFVTEGSRDRWRLFVPKERRWKRWSVRMLEGKIPLMPRLQTFEDIAWALLNSGEFLFNH